MLVRVDTGVAFLFWRSQLLFMDLFLRVPIRTINNQAILVKYRQKYMKLQEYTYQVGTRKLIYR